MTGVNFCCANYTGENSISWRTSANLPPTFTQVYQVNKSFVIACVAILLGILIAILVNWSPSLVEQNGIAKQERKGAESKRDATADPIVHDRVSDDVDEVVGSLVKHEQLIRSIEPALSRLTQSILNLDFPIDGNGSVFADPVSIRDIAEIESHSGGIDKDSGINQAGLVVSLDDLRTVTFEQDTQIWNALVERFEFFDQAKFYAIKVTESSSLPGSFSTSTGFEAVGMSRQQKWISVKARGICQWKQDSSEWKIAKWDFDQFEVAESPAKLFGDTTQDCLNKSDYAHASDSSHRRLFLNALMEGGFAFKNSNDIPFFRHVPTGQHPSVCVVDINDDGWDDFYLIQQWRKNLLYINNGDSTFREAAADFGLDVDGYGTSGVFADFDNDGDQDLFLGRSLVRSVYLENDQGKFVDRSHDRFNFALPYLASSVSAADYDNDGLLDIYVSTYGFPSGHLDVKQWTSKFLSREHANRVTRITNEPNRSRYLDAAGPPNVLIKNFGSRFEVSKANAKLHMYANSLQATWSDYDGDGDQDVYICNDFARDFLFRNDGNQSFKDVTLEFGDETMMGLGMGVSWGDFDQDNRPDLYVSNMFSKAGLRIVEHFDTLDGGFRQSADGNRLYTNHESGMKLVSANNGPGLNVHRAGWSWGGQFVDVNNDGFLDIYVSSGYFSAPAAFSSGKDL